MNKKKLCFVSAAVMAISLILSGCGRQEEPQSIQDIRAETEQLSNGADKVDTSEMLNYEHLGSQFWKGERIQLWGERQFEGCRLYLHREDGSRELLAEGVDRFQLDGRWWIDGDKRCYILKSDGIMRIGSDGSVTFDNETGKNVNSICQLEDGRLIVLTWGERSQVLAELDPDTGAMNKTFSRNSMLNVLAAVDENVGLENVKCPVKLLTFVAGTADFYDQPAVANGGSELLVQLFGDENAPSRSAIGCSSLPGNIPVETEAVFELL